MSTLGGSTAPQASGGSSAAGFMATASTPSPGGGATGPGATGGGLTRLAADGGASGLGAGGTSSAPEPNGAATPLGRLVAGTLSTHAHEDAASGGLIDYARLLVATAPPAAPATPSDAFWLNPAEEA